MPDCIEVRLDQPARRRFGERVEKDIPLGGQQDCLALLARLGRRRWIVELLRLLADVQMAEILVAVLD